MNSLKKYFFLVFIFIISPGSIFSQGYYKDIFMDGGVGLLSSQFLAAQINLNLSMEFIAAENTVLQNSVMVSNSMDENGVLLYPDGEPRFRVIYTNGGTPDGGATNHGISLGDNGRKRIRHFFQNGGSYTGSCAGAYIVSMSSNSYYRIWPGLVNGTTLVSTYTGHFIPADSPLLNYYNFGNDYYIANIYHNGGCYPVSFPVNTEILLRYDYPSIPTMHQEASCWAYKPDETSGRLVVIGSHPEIAFGGEGLDLMSAMLLYAIDGLGTPVIKGTLSNGEWRMMDKNTSDDDPAFTKIGDRQYHHFMVKILPRSQNLHITLDGDDNQPFNLYAKKDSFAFENTADYSDTTSGSDKILTISNLTPGDWYIGIECDTTIIATYNGEIYDYSGNLSILNGSEYAVKAEWYDPNAYPQNMMLSSRFIRAFTDSCLINTGLYNPYNQNVRMTCEIINPDSNYADSFPMFDDGLHNDSLSGDGFYGGYVGPVHTESHFQFGITVEDLDYGYQNQFLSPGKFTTIGPVKISDVIFFPDTIRPGDRVPVKLLLSNMGTMASAPVISAEIFSIDTSLASIYRPFSLRYGTISPGDTIDPLSGFLIDINENCPVNAELFFTTEIASQGYMFWRDTFSISVNGPTGLDLSAENMPPEFTLFQNYPNPFNASTKFQILISKPSFVTLKIYNITGEEVETLLSDYLLSGSYDFRWSRPAGMASGVYLYRLQTDDYVETKKMIILN